MTLETLYFAFLFVVMLATVWDIKRNQRIMGQILRDVQASAERIAQHLGADRR
jgi:hypothetical protein